MHSHLMRSVLKSKHFVALSATVGTVEFTDTKGIGEMSYETGAVRPQGVVLHVEDEQDSRIATSMLLADAGFDVRGADSPKSAIEEARKCGDSLDVLIVDYHLRAEMTGTEVVEAIGRLLGQGLPTVILTGDPANAEVPWVKNCPVWLARKPLPPETLIAGLSPLVQFRRAMKKLGG